MSDLREAMIQEQDVLEEELARVRALLEVRRARPCVLQFAALQERLLRKHDDDRGVRGWASDSADVLVNRLDDELKELRQAIASGTPQEIAKEAGDVSNFAMMIADNTGELCT